MRPGAGYAPKGNVVERGSVDLVGTDALDERADVPLLALTATHVHIADHVLDVELLSLVKRAHCLLLNLRRDQFIATDHDDRHPNVGRYPCFPAGLSAESAVFLPHAGLLTTTM